MDALHVDEELSNTLFAAALKTNLTPNATTFSLDDLDHHNIIEHDEKERLPVELGWEKQETPISTSDLDSMIERVMQATKEIENSQEM
ncbi:unnamed protein product [Aspergillus oryzae var. brunneus]|uniref:Unnamed protein product n=1 Tax=Aspergillus oryzae var. brunneus TaxID=332754 RepID=A0ABQ6L4L2_ASPOZ|nr:unnamed protein product [Aspergillus oryzae var. brunneus]